MFEHRLGLALGKSIGEVRSLPYDEFVAWKLFYRLEPWGWHDREYRTAVLLTQLWNTHVSKQSQAKKVDDFYRDMLELIMKAYQEHERELALKEKITKVSPAEKKAMIAKSFGMTAGKEVKIDNSSGHLK